jgi:hypothetical protein
MPHHSPDEFDSQDASYRVVARAPLKLVVTCAPRTPVEACTANNQISIPILYGGETIWFGNAGSSFLKHFHD